MSDWCFWDPPFNAICLYFSFNSDTKIGRGKGWSGKPLNGGLFRPGFLDWTLHWCLFLFILFDLMRTSHIFQLNCINMQRRYSREDVSYLLLWVAGVDCACHSSWLLLLPWGTQSLFLICPFSFLLSWVQWVFSSSQDPFKENLGKFYRSAPLSKGECIEIYLCKTTFHFLCWEYFCHMS